MGNCSYIVRKVKTNDEEKEIIFKQIPQPKITSLIFEGGGIRGIAYYGLYELLYQFKVTHDIQHVAGSSAGSVAAALFALGCKPDEAYEKLVKISYDNFLEKNKPWENTPEFLSNIVKGITIFTAKNHSLSPGNILLSWFREILKDKLGKGDATFRDLHHKILEQEKALTQIEEELKIAKEKNDEQAFKLAEEKKRDLLSHRFKYLYITGTDLGSKEGEVYSFDTKPDMEIAKALRASASFPGVFEPYVYEGRYKTDGGVRANMATHIFQASKFWPKDEKGDLDKDYDHELMLNPAVLAVKIDTKKEIKQAYRIDNEELVLNTLTDHISAYINAQTETVNIEELRNRLVVYLRDLDIPTLKLKLSNEEKTKLIAAAKETTLDFLENFISTAYSLKAVGETVEEWWRSLDDIELDKLYLIYQKMLEAALKSHEKIQDSKVHDPDHPTIAALKYHVEFLDAYARYKNDLKKGKNPALFKMEFPKHHINIKPSLPINSWSEACEKNMRERLEKLKKEVTVKKDILEHVCKFVEIKKYKNNVINKLHANEILYAQVEHVVRLTEEVVQLDEKISILEKKLGINKNSENKKETEEEKRIRKIKSEELANAFRIIELFKSKEVNILTEIWKEVDVYSPVISCDSKYKDKITHLNIDLRDELDRKIFLLATSIFLRLNNNNTEAFDVKFGLPIVENIFQLSEFFHLKGFELLVSSYRLEILINYFDKILNFNKPKNYSLDSIFEDFSRIDKKDNDMGAFDVAKSSSRGRHRSLYFVESSPELTRLENFEDDLKTEINSQRKR